MGGDAPSGDGDAQAGDSGGGPSYQPTTGGAGTIATSGGGPSSGGVPNTGGGPQQLPDCSGTADCNDADDCTTDTCEGGFCMFVDNGTCECRAATATADCNDDNECTTDRCESNECVYAPFVGSCSDDGNACTTDACDGTTCVHDDAGLCGEDTVVLRSMRDGDPGQWVSVNPSSALVWNVASSLGEAALFNRIDSGAAAFKLQAIGNGMWVTIDGSDNLVATSDEADAMVFEAPACPLDGGAGTGLDATLDDASRFVAAEGSGALTARSTGCDSGSGAAWERFEIIPAGG